MFNVEKLNDKVYYFKNVIDKPYEFIEKIEYLDSISSQDKVFVPRVEWNSSNERDFQYGDIQRIIKNNLSKLNKDELNLSNYIINTVDSAMKDMFEYVKNDQSSNDEIYIYPSFCIHRYYKGAAMGAHNDQQDGNTKLKYSVVIYLNDDYEGGELSFVISNTDGELKNKPDEDYNIAVTNNQINFGIKPEAGSALVFPSGSPYYHTAHVVKSGKKYMIPGHWLTEAANA